MKENVYIFGITLLVKVILFNLTSFDFTQFVINLDTTDIESMTVFSEIQLNQTNNPKNEIWSIDRNQGDRWYIARVATDYNTNFRLIFEGTVGKSDKGDFVIIIIELILI
jgi:hypothetical protein